MRAAPFARNRRLDTRRSEDHTCSSFFLSSPASPRIIPSSPWFGNRRNPCGPPHGVLPFGEGGAKPGDAIAGDKTDGQIWPPLRDAAPPLKRTRRTAGGGGRARRAPRRRRGRVAAPSNGVGPSPPPQVVLQAKKLNLVLKLV